MRENLLPVRIIRRQKATPEDTCTDHQICCFVGGALELELVGILLYQLSVDGGEERALPFSVNDIGMYCPRI